MPQLLTALIIKFLNMDKVNQISKEQLLEAAEKFIDLLFEKISEQNRLDTTDERTVLQPDKLLTVQEVCDYYRIKKTTLERCIRDGLKFIQARKNCNRTFRYSECERYFNQKK